MSANRYGLSLSDPDGLEKWRAEGEALEQERRRERAHMQRDQRADTVAQLRAEMQTELAALRAEIASRHDLMHEAIGQVLGELADEAVDCTERAIKRIQSEFWNMLEQRFARVNARIDMISEATHDKTSVDMPNPLASRRGLNS